MNVISSKRLSKRLNRRSNKRLNRRSNKRSTRKLIIRSNRRGARKNNKRSTKKSNRRGARKNNKRSTKKSNRRGSRKNNKRSTKKSNRRGSRMLGGAGQSHRVVLSEQEKMEIATALSEADDQIVSQKTKTSAPSGKSEKKPAFSLPRRESSWQMLNTKYPSDPTAISAFSDAVVDESAPSPAPAPHRSFEDFALDMFGNPIVSSVQQLPGRWTQENVEVDPSRHLDDLNIRHDRKPWLPANTSRTGKDSVQQAIIYPDVPNNKGFAKFESLEKKAERLRIDPQIALDDTESGIIYTGEGERERKEREKDERRDRERMKRIKGMNPKPLYLRK